MANILIIDDDESFRATLAEILVDAGHRVTVAVDGLEGAQLCRARPPDLVLTDIMMPHGGLMLIRVLHEQFPEVKVIAMTGAGTYRLDYARTLGVRYTLHKPFTPAQLLDALAATLATDEVKRWETERRPDCN